VRKGELENVERNRDKSLGVSVYLGQRRGNASTSDFSAAAIQRTVQAAYDIARFTAEDPAAGLPDADDLATPAEVARDLDLFHPWAIDAEQAAELAPSAAKRRRCPPAADHQLRRRRRVGAAVALLGRQHARLPRRLCQFAPLRVGVADRRPRPHMQRDSWYTSMRDAAELAAPEAVGRYAAERALSRLKPRRCPRPRCRCCSRTTVASGLLGSLCAGHLGRRAVPQGQLPAGQPGPARAARAHRRHEDPHVPKGKGSAPFDDEGVRTRARKVVEAAWCRATSCRATRRASWA
jgi:PmbA protein